MEDEVLRFVSVGDTPSRISSLIWESVHLGKLSTAGLITTAITSLVIADGQHVLNNRKTDDPQNLILKKRIQNPIG